MSKATVTVPQTYHVKRGDTVKVISGNFRGNTGEVLEVLRGKARAVVRILEKGPSGEELNMIKKHAKPTQDNPQGGIQEQEGTIHVSNLKVIEATAASAKGEKKATKSKSKKG